MPSRQPSTPRSLLPPPFLTQAKDFSCYESKSGFIKFGFKLSCPPAASSTVQLSNCLTATPLFPPVSLSRHSTHGSIYELSSSVFQCSLRCVVVKSFVVHRTDSTRSTRRFVLLSNTHDDLFGTHTHLPAYTHTGSATCAFKCILL